MYAKIHAVVFDVDGTLYNYKTRTVPPSTIEALNRLHSRGIRVILASGRSKALLGNEVVQAARPDGFVLANGHELLDSNEGILSLERFSRRQTDHILELACNNNLYVMLKYHGFNCIYSGWKEMLEVFREVGFSPQMFRYCPEWNYHKQNLPIGITLKGPQSLQKVLSGCGKEFRVELFYNPSECDVFLRRVNKLTGIKRLLRGMGIRLEQCIAFGDSGNDVDMLRNIGLGVAMGNACPEAKAAAKQICACSWENGIFQCLSDLKVI